jgi:hypothetical protein
MLGGRHGHMKSICGATGVAVVVGLSAERGYFRVMPWAIDAPGCSEKCLS